MLQISDNTILVIKYQSMKLSLIIPTLNASRHIEGLLSSLSLQDTRPTEIVIIDSSSDDDTVEIAKKFGANTIVIPRQKFNHGGTRNMAAEMAQGDVLAFMTQDALPADNSLFSRLTAPLERPDIAAAYGRQVPRPDASAPEVFARQFNYPDKDLIKSASNIATLGIKTFFFSNVCSAIKKEPFSKVGMFPHNIRFNEDMIIAAKLILNGYKTAYVPEAAVIHSHNYSLLRQFIRYYNIGSSLKDNNWILKYAKPEGEGMRFIKEQMSFLLKRHKYSWLPYIFLEHAVKYAGYRLGLIAG